ncbi:MAG: hypothetical protein K6E87_03335 [bacterium]|nr:hypothetical protein [bacterium]
MPAKKNNGGNEQNYIAKGNGEHSGEYTYSSFSGNDYLSKTKTDKIIYKVDKLNMIPHISIQNSDIIDNIIEILEDGNIPNIESFLDNLFIFSKYQIFGRDYYLRNCTNLDDLKKYIHNFYEKYPLNELKYCLTALNRSTDCDYNHYYGAKYIKGKHTINEDLKLCNPNYDESKDGEYERNCLNCVLALEMRYRNLDVEAKGWVDDPYDSDFRKLFKVFDTLIRDSCVNDSYNNKIKNKIDFLSGRYENARLIFTIKYEHNWHALMLVIDNHEPHFYDPQRGLELSKDFYKQSQITRFEYAQIDDLKIKSREAKKYTKKRGQ